MFRRDAFPWMPEQTFLADNRQVMGDIFQRISADFPDTTLPDIDDETSTSPSPKAMSCGCGNA